MTATSLRILWGRLANAVASSTLSSHSPPPAELAARVLVPLEEAHAHSHCARLRRLRGAASATTGYEPDEDEADGLVMSSSETDEDDSKDRAGENGESAELHERTGMLGVEDTAFEYSIEGLRREVRRGGKEGEWTDYELKAKIINKAIQDIGMGRYNWQLFVLCGFGWFADNLWLQGISLTLPSLSAEFGISEKTVRYTTSSLYIGLCLGSFFWGLGADIMGRRIAFNATLLITATFGLSACFASSWATTCAAFAALGFGVGGNLPVDGALFLEFLPDASSSLLTLLSVWWPIGQLASSLLAWIFIAHWPADQGWRLFVAAIGVVTLIMFAVRFFAFQLLESPKFLLSKGRQTEAVAVVYGIAFQNGVKTWLTEDILDAVADSDEDNDNESISGLAMVNRRRRRRHSFSAADVIRQKLASFSTNRLRPLFRTRKLGLTTTLVWFCWATIGMGYPLFNAFLLQYLSHGGDSDSSSAMTPTPTPSPPVSDGAPALTSEAYRNYAITSLAGVPGSLLAAYAVDHQSPFLGRRGTLAISTLVSAVFLFMFVLFGHTPGSQLVFSCIEAFAQNIMYGVLYAFTPEIFPAPVRGAGTGVASFLNRVTGLMAPVLAATVPGDGTTAPVFLSAALILAAFFGMVAIPIETRGRQRL